MRRTVLSLAVLASGCSLFDGAPAEVGFLVTLPAAPASVEVQAELGGRPVALTDQPTTGDRSLYAEPVEASARRTTVACTVSDGAAATRGAVALDLEAGWRYSVQCAVADADPIAACFGCQGSEAFALAPALGLPAGDSLFVVWGGSDPDNAVLY